MPMYSDKGLKAEFLKVFSANSDVKLVCNN